MSAANNSERTRSEIKIGLDKSFMNHAKLRLIKLALIGFFFAIPTLSFAQIESDSIHEIEVRLKSGTRPCAGVRVRLMRPSGMMTVGETYSSQDGQARFINLLPGEYIIETGANENFEATATRVSVTPIEFKTPRPMRLQVMIDVPARKTDAVSAPGIVLADVDLNIPEAAVKHYRKGIEAQRAGKSDEALKEFKAAAEAHSKFYSARLELGRELRAQKRFAEAEEALRPLEAIAPKRAEPLVEHAIVLMVLRRQKDAARELQKAIEMEETNWAAHLYIGWALLDDEPEKAEQHFTRAIQLNEQKAAQAHLSLARLAYKKGLRDDAIKHLEAYLAIAPDAPDSAAVRKLLGQLRK